MYENYDDSEMMMVYLQTMEHGHGDNERSMCKQKTRTMCERWCRTGTEDYSKKCVNKWFCNEWVLFRMAIDYAPSILVPFRKPFVDA